MSAHALRVAPSVVSCVMITSGTGTVLSASAFSCCSTLEI
jgi:hypothetical protein